MPMAFVRYFRPVTVVGKAKKPPMSDLKANAIISGCAVLILFTAFALYG